jgi:HEAT repeats
MAVWALGRIAPDLGNKAVKPLVNRLHDSYWKVRTAACIAISSLTPNISSQALPHLLKVFVLILAA